MEVGKNFILVISFHSLRRGAYGHLAVISGPTEKETF